MGENQMYWELYALNLYVEVQNCFVPGHTKLSHKGI
jgi:hypothetical protein